MMDFDSLVGMGIIGVFTGFGSALGNYMAQRSFIRHLDKLGANNKK